MLLDLRMAGLDGLRLVEVLRARGEDIPILMISGFGTVEVAVESLHLGADDFLTKPIDPDVLSAGVTELLERRPSPERLAQGAVPGMVGHSAPMRSVFEAVRQVAPTDAVVLITGDTGTGKELVARALHEGSPRAKQAFVKVNCAAIPKDLIESELFGHEKGAFTGATARKIGKIEASSGGTLLLDEVGDMALEAQAKLLRVLEENEVERVGGNRSLPVDVRVLAATNKDLPEAIAAGDFREDLYYRLNVVPIRVPALRERRGDIAELVEHFRSRFQGETGRPLHEFDDSAYEALRAWPWPGNVRELRNVVERLEIMTDGDRIQGADVKRILAEARRPGGSAPDGAPGEAALDEDLTLREILDRTERSVIRRALEAADGVISDAARRLGMDRANLHRKMRRLEMDRDEEGASDPESVSE
jgi:two-component system nitrogen regulation response regulator NtrX